MTTSEEADSRSEMAAAGSAIVFGSTGGIGSALVARLEAGRSFARVGGFSRGTSPGFDLTSEASIASLAEHLRNDYPPPRLVIDATGVLHSEGMTPEKALKAVDAEHLARAFAINAIGPALLMKHVLPLLPRDGRSLFATLSARVGSIGDNRSGGWYAYRASKAALNQLVRTASIELRRTKPEAICVAIHPGTVRTPLTEPFAKAGLDVRTPDVAAAEILDVLECLTPDASGGFFDHNGAPVPW